MAPNVAIRSETDADAAAITEVTAAAFKSLEISNHTALSFDGQTPQGTVAFHDAFKANGGQTG